MHWLLRTRRGCTDAARLTPRCPAWWRQLQVPTHAISLLLGRSSFEVQGDVADLVRVLLQPSACVGAPGHDRKVVCPGFGKGRFDQSAADALAAKGFGDFGVQEVQPIAVSLVLQP